MSVKNRILYISVPDISMPWRCVLVRHWDVHDVSRHLYLMFDGSTISTVLPIQVTYRTHNHMTRLSLPHQNRVYCLLVTIVEKWDWSVDNVDVLSTRTFTSIEQKYHESTLCAPHGSLAFVTCAACCFDSTASSNEELVISWLLRRQTVQRIFAMLFTGKTSWQSSTPTIFKLQGKNIKQHKEYEAALTQC